MKLIIDIPKEYYETVKNEKSPYFNYLEIKVRESIPLEEEFEKVRAEIEEQKQDRCFDDDDMFVYITGLNNAIDIIDKYKNELKGETNDRER